MFASRPWTALISICVALLLLGVSGCACSGGESDYLTLSVGYQGVSTTPKWNSTFRHPVDRTFEATAIWGPEDPAPSFDAFELYRTTSDEPVALDFEASDCTTDAPTDELHGPCAQFADGHSCPFEGRSWQPADELQEGETYLLVFYPARGNGKQLSWDGERKDFEGHDVLMMEIVVDEPPGD